MATWSGIYCFNVTEVNDIHLPRELPRLGGEPADYLGVLVVVSSVRDPTPFREE